MRVFILSAVRTAVARRSLALSIGLSTLLTGCGDKPAANNAETAAPPATTAAPLGMFPTDQTPTLLAVPENRSAIGDRYASTPRIDPAVRPASYAVSNVPPHAGPISRPAPTRPTNKAQALSGGGPGLPASPTEPEFVPGIEDLQLFEQPNLAGYGKAVPAGQMQMSGNVDWKAMNATSNVRHNPLPLSP